MLFVNRDECQFAEREVVSSNPGETTNQGLYKTGKIMLAVINLVLHVVQMIASLDGEVKPLESKHSSNKKC